MDYFKFKAILITGSLLCVLNISITFTRAPQHQTLPNHPSGPLGRRRGQRSNCWMDNVKDWTSCKNCSQWPPSENTGRGSLLIRSIPPTTQIGQGTELNCQEFCIYNFCLHGSLAPLNDQFVQKSQTIPTPFSALN